jgi:hypothetical protein
LSIQSLNQALTTQFFESYNTHKRNCPYLGVGCNCKEHTASNKHKIK